MKTFGKVLTLIRKTLLAALVLIPSSLAAPVFASTRPSGQLLFNVQIGGWLQDLANWFFNYAWGIGISVGFVGVVAFAVVAALIIKPWRKD